MAELKNEGLTVFEYAGIRCNPIIEDVEAAAEAGRKNSVDMVLAVGGGSVIDSVKVIALTIPVSHPAWDFFIGKATPTAALPIITVLTLAATGSEMNPFSVISNQKARLDRGSRISDPPCSMNPSLLSNLLAGLKTFFYPLIVPLSSVK